MSRALVRVGNGFDAHTLVPGRRLVLGGVTVQFERGLEGHADADVVVHAVCDAFLGALGAGDIGTHFPDSVPAYKNADSRVLLRSVWAQARGAGYGLGNLDVTVIAQAPKLAPHVRDMATNIASDLGAPRVQISVKATTTDRLGFAGRGEGIAAL